MKKIIRFTLMLVVIITGFTYNNIKALSPIGDEITTSTEKNGVTTNNTYKIIDSTPNTYQLSVIDVIKQNGSHISTYFIYDNTKPCPTTTSATENCSTKVSVISYLAPGPSQIAYKDTYLNNVRTSKITYARNTNNQITNQTTYNYNTNGSLKRYELKYGGKKLSSTSLVYNKTLVKNYNSNNLVSSTYAYEFSLIWSGASKTILKERIFYSYYSNKKIKQKAIYKKSTKYDKESTRQFITYRTNGKYLKYVKHIYNTNGKRTYRIQYNYNSQGQLKSNKYGKAKRYIAQIKNNKVVKLLKYNYNSKGKAIRYN